MSSPFVAEIRIFGFNFAPKGWAKCNGQLLTISQNTALFSLLGTTYGGDGKVTFALPDLEGRAPMHAGQGSNLSLRDLGEQSGEEFVTLLVTEMPAHNHNAQAQSAAGNQISPALPTPNVWATPGAARNLKMYDPNGNATMNPFALAVTGGSLPHNNMPPYLVLNFCIAMQGVFPPRG